MSDEKHETTKEIYQSSLLLMAVGVLCMMVSVFLFLFDFINLGLVFVLVTIFLFFVCLVGAVKIHSRYTQELILKINNKTWEDFCTCRDCLLKKYANEENK